MINERAGVFHGAKINKDELGGYSLYDYFKQYMDYLYRNRGEELLTDDEMCEQYENWCDCERIISPEYTDFVLVGNFETSVSDNEEDCCIRLNSLGITNLGIFEFIAFLKGEGVASEVGAFFVKYSY